MLVPYSAFMHLKTCVYLFTVWYYHLGNVSALHAARTAAPFTHHPVNVCLWLDNHNGENNVPFVLGQKHFRFGVGCFKYSERRGAISSSTWVQFGTLPFSRPASERLTIHALPQNCLHATYHFLLPISYQAPFVSPPGECLLCQWWTSSFSLPNPLGLPGASQRTDIWCVQFLSPFFIHSFILPWTYVDWLAMCQVQFYILSGENTVLALMDLPFQCRESE